MSDQRGQWGSRVGFILAAAGSAVGLGNVWKFPYITGENGGGLFVLIYLVCIALVGLPIMVAEIMIGRAAHRQPVGAFRALQGRTTRWSSIGWLGVAAGFIILSYYIVVAGWAMDYTLKSIVNFTQPIERTASIEASTRVASTPIDELRAMLAERRAAHEARSDAAVARLEAPPSAWRGWERYSAALADAPDAEAARARLLADPELRDAVELVQPALARVADIEDAARAEATAHWAGQPDEIVVAEAEDVIRRGAIFDAVQGRFVALATDGWMSAGWAAAFMLLTIVIVARGIASGIESVCRVLMPALLVVMAAMVVYGMFQPGFGEAFEFVFRPDASKLKPSGVLEALGHSFFTLSLGMGAMITYGSYQQTRTNLLGQSIWIAGLDTVVALLACLMIFPIIFSYGQEPGAGPGLVFMSMPLAFAEIGAGGMILAIMFFGLLVFAALTSSISLLEVVASYFVDERGWSRPRSAWVIGGLIFLFALPTAFHADPGRLMRGWDDSYGQSFFDTMDYLSSNWLLPVGGLLIAIYAGWVMPARLRDAELADSSPSILLGWLALVRFVAPALVLVVLLQKIGIIDANELFHDLLH